MEDQNAALADGLVAAPFSDFIRDWLDEGDRLDEKAAAMTATAPPSTDGAIRRMFLRVRPVLDRYRPFVLAGVGLMAFALFAATHTHRAVEPAALASSTISTVPSRRSTPPTSEVAPTSSGAAPSTRSAVSSAPTAIGLRSRHRSQHRVRHRSKAPRSH